MANEWTLFRQAEIAVTPTRFMVGSKTYAIRNIVSTEGFELRPGWLGALIGKRKEFKVIITTAAGKITAYSSTDRALVGDLLEALDNAIAKHGTAETTQRQKTALKI